MDELLNTFGQTIKTARQAAGLTQEDLARQAAGLTQEDLAEQVGITARYIMAIENENKQPSMKVLTKIIRALKISADTIFFPETQHIDTKKEHLIHIHVRNLPFIPYNGITIFRKTYLCFGITPLV